MIELFKRCEEAVGRLLEWFLVIIVAVLVLDVLWGVVSRHFLDAPSRWTEEVATFLLIWLSLVGSAVAFRRHEHLGVDFFMGKLDPGAQRLMRIVALVIVIAFAAFVLIGGGCILVAEALAVEQRTPALGVLMGYVYVAVPLSGVCIVLFTATQVLAEWHPVTSADDKSDPLESNETTNV